MSRSALLILLVASVATAAPPQPAQKGLKQRAPKQPAGAIQVAAGTHILLAMINSVSTKVAHPGDRIYLETAFPVFINRQLVIPQGSWVTATVTSVKRPGRFRGRGELRIRFDSLMLPNGVTRKFHAGLSSIDERQNETLNRENGKIKGAGNKKDDAGTVVRDTAAGTVIGSGIGAAAGNVGRGAGVGLGAGAAAGLLGVFLTRGPDAMLRRGSTVEMVLDRSLSFQKSDLNFRQARPAAPMPSGSAPPPAQQNGDFQPFPHVR
ncbi:MAG TPA: hypothetical protein VF283_08200 [Bryobacteraceae bacterium]